MSTTINKSEQAVAYAALILADESIAITPEKLQALLKAAGIEDVEPIWTTLFANALKDKNFKEVLTAVTAAPAGRNTAADTKEDGKTPGDDNDNEKDGDEGIDIDADPDDGSTFGDLFG
jgi:large subunit ribosomal protein LP1